MGAHRLCSVLETGWRSESSVKAQRVMLIPMRRGPATDGHVVPGFYGVEQTHGLSMWEQQTDLIFRETCQDSISMRSRCSSNKFMYIVSRPLLASVRSTGNNRAEGLSNLSRSRS